MQADGRDIEVVKSSKKLWKHRCCCRLLHVKFGTISIGVLHLFYFIYEVNSFFFSLFSLFYQQFISTAFKLHFFKLWFKMIVSFSAPSISQKKPLTLKRIEKETYKKMIRFAAVFHRISLQENKLSTCAIIFLILVWYTVSRYCYIFTLPWY